MNSTALFTKVNVCPLFLLFFLLQSSASFCQTSVSGSTVLCTIKTGGKTYNVKPNEIGYFEQVSEIAPRAKVSLELYYSNGKVGEKVILSVEDGGTLDNGKTVKVITLNSAKKGIFNFQLTGNPGLFRISTMKGEDEHVVQLWVGETIPPVRL